MKMHHMHLRGLDLNLLPALEALLRHKNVTQAAMEIGLSQPAMSRALGRLRHLFHDPLLVRAAGGMALTPRARELIGPVQDAVHCIQQIYLKPELSLSTIKRTVRMAATDTQGIMIAPLIAARLSREAPHVDLHMEAYSVDLVNRMEKGVLDFAFALSSTPLPPGAASMELAQDRLALVMRRGHPMAKKQWMLSHYAAVGHVTVSILGDGRSDLDALLASQGVSRRIAMVTPHFAAALAAVSATDLVTTLSHAFASRFQHEFDLVLVDPPLPNAELRNVLVWAKLQSGDPFLAWMRTVISEASQEAWQAKTRPAVA
jgi:DNA-binding transcriptional LysR family regulator